MADNVTLPGTGEVVSTDDAGAGGQVQRIKLAYSADGSATHVPADADGLLVNLGANNDVTVTGTVTATLAAGTAYAAKVRITDGTNDLSVDTVHDDAESNTENHLDVAAKNQVFNGTTWDRMRGDITNGLDVDVTRLPTAQIGSNSGVKNEGCTGHGVSDAGAPVKMGFKAEATPSTITLVTDGQRTDGYADLDGLQMVKPYTSYGDILVERITDTGGTSTAFTTFGATVGARNFVTTIIVYNSSATAGFLDLRDGTGGSVIMTIPLPAGGGAVVNLPVPLRQPTTNTALAYDVSAALTTVYISLVGFKSKA